LDQIVERVPGFAWRLSEADLALIDIPRDGFWDRLARLFKKTPKIYTVELDSISSFVWVALDGQKTVREIGLALSERFGPACEPVYERLSLFLRILGNNRLIRLIETEN
jgi:hypothetical protein